LSGVNFDVNCTFSDYRQYESVRDSIFECNSLKDCKTYYKAKRGLNDGELNALSPKCADIKLTQTYKNYSVRGCVTQSECDFTS
jgi:hypothetical protein